MTKREKPVPFKYRNRYRAQVTNPGTKKRETKYFEAHRDALLWINERIHTFETNKAGRLGGPGDCTLAEFLTEYAYANVIAKAGCKQDINRINCYLEAAGQERLTMVSTDGVVGLKPQTKELSEKMTDYLQSIRRDIEPVWELRAELASKLCSELTRDDFALLISTMRLCGNSPSTIQKEIALVRAAFNVAIRDWGWSAYKNPALDFTLGKSKIVIPQYAVEQIAELVKQAKAHHNSLVAPAIELALETLIRKGQLMTLKWTDIDFQQGSCKVRIKKSAVSGIELTSIPLTRHALDILSKLRNSNPLAEHVFEGLSGEMLSNAFDNLRERVGLPELRFHDLRHIGATLCARANMSAHQLRLMLGHKTLHMALIYVDLAARDVKNFLDGHMGGAVFNLERMRPLM